MFINRKTIPTQMLLDKVCKTKGYSMIKSKIMEDNFTIEAVIGKDIVQEIKIPFTEIAEMFEWKKINVGRDITKIVFKDDME